MRLEPWRDFVLLSRRHGDRAIPSICLGGNREIHPRVGYKTSNRSALDASNHDIFVFGGIVIDEDLTSFCTR